MYQKYTFPGYTFPGAVTPSELRYLDLKEKGQVESVINQLYEYGRAHDWKHIAEDPFRLSLPGLSPPDDDRAAAEKAQEGEVAPETSTSS